MKKIPLTQGKYALVDDEDFEELSKHKWQYNKSLRTGYAQRSSPWVDYDHPRHAIMMHREILGAQDGVEVDHINLNGLDNRRANLRTCPHNLNVCNSPKRRGACSSRFKGVSWAKPMKAWRARIQFEKRAFFLGYFDREEEAALAYNLAAKECRGDFAYLNEI